MVIISGSGIEISFKHRKYSQQLHYDGDRFGTPVQINSKLSECADMVKKVVVKSSLKDVKISICHSSTTKVQAHLYGQAEFDGIIDFEVHLINRKIIIQINHTGDNFNNINLKLDILVPQNCSIKAF